MAHRYNNEDIAPIGYKIKKGDWIVCQLANTKLEKSYQVTKVTNTRAIVEFNTNSGRSRKALRFPRHYSLPFFPLTKKTKPNYTSPNKWFVVMKNDISHLRLRFD